MSLIALALAPGFAISLSIYLLDRHEREPFRLMILSFCYGLLSVALTLIITFIVEGYVPVFENVLINELARAFLGVALIEEGSKFLFLIFLIYPLKDFNEPFDGIVYAVMISMGFATLENVLYSLNGGVGVALLRMFTAVPAHAAFAVIMGYFAGLAKFRFNSPSFAVLGLIFATILHGLYDYFLFISHIPGIFVGSLIALTSGLYLSWRAIKIHSNASPFKKRIGRVNQD